MAIREYIGARYVPKFYDNGQGSAEWDSSVAYEPLTIVLYEGNSYTSRQYVPVGASITDTKYWLETGNWNSQVEQYRQEVLAYDGRIEAVEEGLVTESEARADADQILQGSILAEEQAREEAVGAVEEKVNSIVEGTTLGVLNFGQIVYDDNNGMPDHPGAIAQYGDTQYIISSPINESASGIGTIKGHFRTVSIEGNRDNWANKVEADYGHANSMCYSKELNSLVYAPLWRVDGSNNKTWCNFVELLSTQGVIGRRIYSNYNETGARISVVSYDAVTETTYAFGELPGGDFLRILKYNADNDLFEDTGINIYYPLTATTLRQDIAVKNNRFYACDPNGGVRIGDITTGEIQAIRSIEQVPVSAAGEVFQEWDGWEFNDNGDLLQLVHSELSTTEADGGPTYLCREACCGIVQVIVDDSTPTYARYADIRLAAPMYTAQLNPESTSLQSRGSDTAPWKGFFQAQLSMNNTKRIMLQTDYNAEVLFFFKPLTLYIQPGKIINVKALRFGCEVRLSGGNRTGSSPDYVYNYGVINIESHIRYSHACFRVLFTKYVQINLPSNYEISRSGYYGLNIIISNEVDFPNGIRYGNTTLPDVKEASAKSLFMLLGVGVTNNFNPLT